eukprot:Stramenopile-MAST_4_protein_4042
MIRPLRLEFLDRLDKDDDGGNFTTADERHEVLRICKAYYDTELPRPGKHGTLENGERVEKMARQMEPGTLMQTFEFYAALFAPHQQLIKKVPTYSEIKFANNTLSQGELMCFCNDFELTPKVVSRNDIRHIWPYIQEEHAGVGGVSNAKRIGKELSLEGFKQFLVRVAMVNMVAPQGRQVVLSRKQQPHEAVQALCDFLNFGNSRWIKKKIKTAGTVTQLRLGGQKKAIQNPYTVHDSKRFKICYPPKKGDDSITGMIAAAKAKRELVAKPGHGLESTLTVGVYKMAMAFYKPSLKAIFKPFEAVPVLNEWVPFIRDRPSGQICRCYIDAGDVIVGHVYKFKVVLQNQSDCTVKLGQPFLEPYTADEDIRLDAKFDPRTVAPRRYSCVVISLVLPHQKEYNCSVVFTSSPVGTSTARKALVRCPLYVVSHGVNHRDHGKSRLSMTLRERMTTPIQDDDEGAHICSTSDVDGDDAGETEEEEAARKRRELTGKLLGGPYVEDLERKTSELWDELHRWREQKSANNAHARHAGCTAVRELMRMSVQNRPPGTMPIVPPFDQILKMEMLSPSPHFIDPAPTPKWMVNGEMSAPQEFNQDGSVKARNNNHRDRHDRPPARAKKLPFLPPVTTYSIVDFRKDGDVYRAIHGKNLIGTPNCLHSLTLPNTSQYSIRRKSAIEVLARQREHIAVFRTSKSVPRVQFNSS